MCCSIGTRTVAFHLSVHEAICRLASLRSRGWFRSTDLWVMGPARFLCATLLKKCDGPFQKLRYGNRIELVQLT